MTELQNYIFSGLGIATIMVIQWLLKKLFSNYDKSKADGLKRVEESRVRMEGKLDEVILRQKATAGALANMNSIPELETFSRQFKNKYEHYITKLKSDPGMEDIL